MKGVRGRTGDDENCVGEMGEGRVSAKPGRPLLLLLLGMTRHRVGASTRCGLLWNSCVVMRSPEAVKRLEKTTPESWSTKVAVDDDKLLLLLEASCERQGSGVWHDPRDKRGRET